MSFSNLFLGIWYMHLVFNSLLRCISRFVGSWARHGFHTPLQFWPVPLLLRCCTEETNLLPHWWANIVVLGAEVPSYRQRSLFVGLNTFCSFWQPCEHGSTLGYNTESSHCPKSIPRVLTNAPMHILLLLVHHGFYRLHTLGLSLHPEIIIIQHTTISGIHVWL